MLRWSQRVLALQHWHDLEVRQQFEARLCSVPALARWRQLDLFSRSN